MRKYFHILLVCFACLTLSAAEFKDDGTFSGKSGSFQLSPRFRRILFTSNDGFPFEFFVEYSLPKGGPSAFYKTCIQKDSRKEIDAKNRTASLKTSYLLDGTAIPSSYTLSLSPDGKRVRLLVPAEKEFADRKIRRSFCMRSIPFRKPLRKICLDGKEIHPEKEDSIKPEVLPWRGKFREISFASSGVCCLKMYPPSLPWTVKKLNRPDGYHVGFFIPFPCDKDAVFEFDIDDPAVEHPKRVGGVDFRTDGLENPNLSGSKNLVGNSSFEAGFDSWQEIWHGDFLPKAPAGEFFSIDPSTAFHGKKSLRMVSPAGKFLAALSPFVIPVNENETLTLSFYAKTDKPGIAKLIAFGHGIVFHRFSLQKYNIFPGKEWKRFSATFTTKSKMLVFTIAPYRPSEDCTIWIDGIQLERGNKMTEYADNTFPVFLKTADRSCAVWGDAPFHAKLHSIGNPGKGSLNWSVSDFFGKEITKGVKERKETIDFPELDKLPFGSFVLTVEIPESGKRHFRLARMHDLSNNFPNRRIFGVPEISNRTAVFRDRVKTYGKSGIGSMLAFRSYWDECAQLLQKNHIRLIGNIFQGKVLGKYSITRTKKPEDSILNLKDSELPLVEEYVYKLANKNPYVKVWKICNEPNLTQEEMVRALDVFAAARRGLRRAIPDARILTPEATGIGEGGRNQLMDWLQIGCGKVCDLPATHTYRSPDHQLDTDIRTLLDSLSKRMPGEKIYLSEGIYYTQYNLPDLKLQAYHDNTLADHFRLGSFGYAIGKGERASLANTMRSRIVTLKYAEKIGCDIDWAFSGGYQFLGYDGVPKSIFFSINTPAYLLGNARFIQDIPLGEQILGYLFEDAEKRPVAVFWNIDPDVLSGAKKGNHLNLSLFQESCEVFDLLGNRMERGKSIAVNGYPVFLRGKSGRTAAFVSAFGKAGICDAAGGGIRFAYDFGRDGSFRLSLGNQYREKLSGKLSVSINGEKYSEEICELAPKTVFRKNIPLPQKTSLQHSRIHAEFRSPILMEQMETDVASAKILPVPAKFALDGDLSEWNDHPFWKMGNQRVYDKKNKDSSSGAEMAVGWDSGKLYFAFRVRDDKFFPVMPIRKSWMGDGIQIFFDSLADAGCQKKSGYNGDDQSYMVGFGADNSVEVYRDLAPDQQQAFVTRGKVPAAKGSFRKTEDGWNLELVIPMSELEPIRLKDGAVFGMSACVNDNDGNGRKQAFFLNRSGEAHQNPRGYPVFFLKRTK